MKLSIWLVDLVEDLYRDFLLRQRRSGDLHQLALVEIAGDEEKVDEEQDHRELAEEPEKPHAAHPEIVARRGTAGSTICTRCTWCRARRGVIGRRRRGVGGLLDLFGGLLHLRDELVVVLPALRRDAIADAPRGVGDVGDDRRGFVAQRVDAEADAADEDDTAIAAPAARGSGSARARRPAGSGRSSRRSPMTIGIRTICAYCSARISASAAMMDSDRLRTSTGMRMTSGSGFGSSGVAFCSPAFCSTSGVTGSFIVGCGQEHESCPRASLMLVTDFDFDAPRRTDRANRGATRANRACWSWIGHRRGLAHRSIADLPGLLRPAISWSSTTLASLPPGYWVTGCQAVGQSSAYCSGRDRRVAALPRAGECWKR